MTEMNIEKRFNAPISIDCVDPWRRPAGYQRAKVTVLKKTPSGQAICLQTPYFKNGAPTIGTQVRLNGPRRQAPCRPGSYKPGTCAYENQRCVEGRSPRQYEVAPVARKVEAASRIPVA